LLDPLQVNGYVLIVGNNIDHLPLTSLRVIRGKSLLQVKVPPYASTTTTTDRPTTIAGETNYIYDDDGGLKNVSKVYDDMDWKNISVEVSHTCDHLQSRTSQNNINSKRKIHSNMKVYDSVYVSIRSPQLRVRGVQDAAY